MRRCQQPVGGRYLRATRVAPQGVFGGSLGSYEPGKAAITDRSTAQWPVAGGVTPLLQRCLDTTVSFRVLSVTLSMDRPAVTVPSISDYASSTPSPLRSSPNLPIQSPSDDGVPVRTFPSGRSCICLLISPSGILSNKISFWIDLQVPRTS